MRILSRVDGVGVIGLMMVILFVAMSATTVVLVIKTSTSEASLTEKKGKALRTAINAYKLNHGAALTAPPALTSLVTTDGVACTFDNTPASGTYLKLQGWCGPYMDQPISENANDYRTDGWGTTFTYVADVVRSCGPDRTCGNADDLTY